MSDSSDQTVPSRVPWFRKLHPGPLLVLSLIAYGLAAWISRGPASLVFIYAPLLIAAMLGLLTSFIAGIALMGEWLGRARCRFCGSRLQLIGSSAATVCGKCGRSQGNDA